VKETGPLSTTLLMSVNGMLWQNFSKSAVVHAKMGHEPNHTPYRGDL